MYVVGVWRRKTSLAVESRPGAARPDGWRPPDEFVVRGRVPAGEFEFERPAWGRRGEERHQGHYRFESVTASGTRFLLDGTVWVAAGSRFEDCVFRQQQRGPSRDYAGAQGTFGDGERCLYVKCLFDHVDFGQRGGGFFPGDARFERCTFRFCQWRWFQATRADFVDCTFEGVMKRAWFYGADPQDRERVNEFARNDFTQAKLRAVEFRAGLDLRDAQLPQGPEYLRLEHLRSRIAAAREAIQSWPDSERPEAETILDIYDGESIDTLFAWRGSLPAPDSRVWQLLERPAS